METEELIEHLDRLIDKITSQNLHGGHAEAAEFLRTYAGPNSRFLKAFENMDLRLTGPMQRVHAERSQQILRSYRDALVAGAIQGLSPERKAELDVVSDFLEMAQNLLDTKGVHPAAATVLIGASLEEFLRSWVDAEGLSLGTKKPGLESYSQVLREAGHLDKQDGKDITSWAGTRNDAAHGHWDKVSDPARIRLMLEGVNLFMRKHTPGSGT